MAASSPSATRVSHRPIGRYILLGVLFVIATAYHLRVVMYREPTWFGWHPVLRPFFIDEPGMASNGRHNNISFVIDEPRRAGLKPGDRVLEINGRKVVGPSVLGEELRKAKPGDTMTVVAERDLPGGQTSRESYSFNLIEFHGLSWLQRFPGDVLLVYLPFVSTLIGFWVTAMRPQDKRAWLVLALMLGFLSFGDPNAMTWPPVARDLAIAFRHGNSNLFAVWLFLFGIYFPEEFPASSPWTKWLRYKWLVIGPLLFFAVTETAVAIGELENYSSVLWLERLPKALTIAEVMLTYTAAGLGMGFIASKHREAVSRDAKRRLRLLAVGGLFTLGPFAAVRAFAIIFGINPELYFPYYIWFTADILFFLFPAVLAYVIVIHRAMDVRFVLRQGMQYTLARGGVRVIQFLVSAIAVVAAAALAANRVSNRATKVLIVVLALALVPLIRGAADRLRGWIDRRFFREAYDAEHVLAELSDQVRSMVKPQSLLETVATRIAETLHVSKIAVLLDSGSPFRPVYALGYAGIPELQFPPGAASVKLLTRQKEPLRVYADDENSWLYREEGVTAEERAELQQLDAELLLPLSSRDKLLGFISLGPKRSEEPFTGTDLRLLKSVATQTGLALENAQLLAAITEEVAQRERLNREVEIAREVQERLFPQELPQIAGLDYFGACRPALGVGGDYYDFLALADGQLGIALGDVSGKGIGAALLMASLQASLRAEAARASDQIAPVVANVNRLVYQASTSNRYATFFYAQYNPARHELTYVNAGHNPPMLFRKSANAWEVLRLEAGGTVVGLLPSFPYQQQTLVIQPGDLLVIYTDGVSEAMNPADEEWGEEPFAEAVEACASLPAKDILGKIMVAADAFAAGAKQHDDMTLVVMKFL